MRCRYCHEPAGWWRRRCADCRSLVTSFVAHRGADLVSMLDALAATGVRPEKIERFLDADPDGDGCARDQIAADMTNQLLEAMGQRARQSSADVKRIRERGGWTALDRRPRE